MNKRWTQIFIALTLGTLAAAASAAPSVYLYIPLSLPHQVGDTSRARGAMSATAVAYYPFLSVGAGFTISCHQLTIQIDEQNHGSSTSTSFPEYFNALQVNVPPNPNSVIDRDLGWWMPAGECRTCAFSARGIAAERQVSLAGGAKGFSITFGLGPDEATVITTPTFQMCRPAVAPPPGCSVADPALTLLTAAGEATRLDAIPVDALTRKGNAEDGRPMVMDEHALVKVGAEGARLSYTSMGFDDSPVFLEALRSGKSDGVAGFLTVGAVDRKSPLANGLLIKHQRAHPVNHNFAPVPVASFTPQPLEDVAVQGERGFAIVEIGGSGTVKHVQAVSTSGRIALPAIKEGLARAVSSRSPDERQHDHTVYWAFEVQNGILTSVGKPIVTLPMCCGPHPPCPRPPGVCP